MKIILFGATGQTGKIFLNLALERGHEVTALVRDANKISVSHENLKIITINIYNQGDVTQAMRGHDLVVSCLGGNANTKSSKLFDMVEIIVAAMKASGVKNIFSVHSAGIHGEMPGIISKIIVSLLYKNAVADHSNAAHAIINSGLKYLVMRPLSLVNGEMTKHYRISYDSVPRGGSKISREDLAYFMAEAIGKEELINKSVAICY